MDQLTKSKMMMQINNLPSLPEVTQKVVQLIDNPKSSPFDIAQEICRDQVLASKVLKLVNSVYYGLPRRIGTVSEAVTLLGMGKIKTLVVGASVQDSLSLLSGRKAINPKKIWRHALACAACSKILAQRLQVCQWEQAFVAGLLHDIGKNIFSYFLAEEYSTVIELSEAKSSSLVRAEKEVLSFTHAEIGRMLAEKWNLPTTLVEPIAYHHDPMVPCESSALVQVVHIADAAAILGGYNTTDSYYVDISDSVMTKLKVPYPSLQDLAEEIRGKITMDFD